MTKNVVKDFLYEDESFKIRGACFDEKQFWGYLKGSKYKLGFLINFGPQKLTIKRFAHTTKLSA